MHACMCAGVLIDVCAGGGQWNDNCLFQPTTVMCMQWKWSGGFVTCADGGQWNDNCLFQLITVSFPACYWNVHAVKVKWSLLPVPTTVMHMQWTWSGWFVTCADGGQWEDLHVGVPVLCPQSLGTSSSGGCFQQFFWVWCFWDYITLCFNHDTMLSLLLAASFLRRIMLFVCTH